MILTRDSKLVIPKRPELEIILNRPVNGLASSIVTGRGMYLETVESRKSENFKDMEDAKDWAKSCNIDLSPYIYPDYASIDALRGIGEIATNENEALLYIAERQFEQKKEGTYAYLTGEIYEC